MKEKFLNDPLLMRAMRGIEQKIQNKSSEYYGINKFSCSQLCSSDMQAKRNIQFIVKEQIEFAVPQKEEGPIWVGTESMCIGGAKLQTLILERVQKKLPKVQYDPKEFDEIPVYPTVIIVPGQAQENDKKFSRPAVGKWAPAIHPTHKKDTDISVLMNSQKLESDSDKIENAWSYILVVEYGKVEKKQPNSRIQEALVVKKIELVIVSPVILHTKGKEFDEVLGQKIEIDCTIRLARIKKYIESLEPYKTFDRHWNENQRSTNSNLHKELLTLFNNFSKIKEAAPSDSFALFLQTARYQFYLTRDERLNLAHAQLAWCAWQLEQLAYGLAKKHFPEHFPKDVVEPPFTQVSVHELVFGKGKNFSNVDEDKKSKYQNIVNHLELRTIIATIASKETLYFLASEVMPYIKKLGFDNSKAFSYFIARQKSAPEEEIKKDVYQIIAYVLNSLSKNKTNERKIMKELQDKTTIEKDQVPPTKEEIIENKGSNDTILTKSELEYECNKKIVEKLDTPNSESSIQFVQVVKKSKNQEAIKGQETTKNQETIKLPYEGFESHYVYEDTFNFGNLAVKQFVSQKVRNYTSKYTLSKNLESEMLFKPIVLQLIGKAQEGDTDFENAAEAEWYPVIRNDSDSRRIFFVYALHYDGDKLICREDVRGVPPKGSFNVNNYDSKNKQESTIKTVEIPNEVSKFLQEKNPEVLKNLQKDHVLMLVIEAEEYKEIEPPYEKQRQHCYTDNLEEDILPKREIYEAPQKPESLSTTDDVNRDFTHDQSASFVIQSEAKRGFNEIDILSERSAGDTPLPQGRDSSSRGDKDNQQISNKKTPNYNSPVSSEAVSLKGEISSCKEIPRGELKHNLAILKVTIFAIAPVVIHSHGKAMDEPFKKALDEVIDYKLDNIQNYYESMIRPIEIHLYNFSKIDFASYCQHWEKNKKLEPKKIEDMPVLLGHTLLHLAGLDVNPLYCRVQGSEKYPGFIYLGVISDYFNDNNKGNRQKFCDAFKKGHAFYKGTDKNDKNLHEFYISIHEFNKQRRKAYEFLSVILNNKNLSLAYLDYPLQKDRKNSSIWSNVFMEEEKKTMSKNLVNFDTIAKSLIGIDLQADTFELSLISMYGIREPLNFALFQSAPQEVFYCDFYLTLTKKAAEKLVKDFNRDFKKEHSSGMRYMGEGKYFSERYDGTLTWLLVDIRSFLLPEFEKKFKSALKYFKNHDEFYFMDRLQKQLNNKTYQNMIAVDLKCPKKDSKFEYSTIVESKEKTQQTPKKLWNSLFVGDFIKNAEKKYQKGKKDSYTLFLNSAQVLDKNSDEFEELCSQLQGEDKKIDKLLTSYAKLFWCAYQLYRLGKLYLHEHPKATDDPKFVRDVLNEMYSNQFEMIENKKDSKEQTALKNAYDCIQLANALIEIAVTHHGILQEETVIKDMKCISSYDEQFFSTAKSKSWKKNTSQAVEDCLSGLEMKKSWW